MTPTGSPEGHERKDNTVKYKELVTTGYDRADLALDKLEVMERAIGGGPLEEQAANGATVIMVESIKTLREYINAVRDELLTHDRAKTAD